MAFSKFRPGFRRATTDAPTDAPVQEDAISPAPENKTTTTATADAEAAAENDPEKPSLELPTQDAQRGVQNVEAVALTWSKKGLAAIFGK